MRIAVTLVTLLIGVWMIAYTARLRSKGANPIVAAQRGSNYLQRLLIGLGAVLDLYLLLRTPFPMLDALVATRPSPLPLVALLVLIAGAIIIVLGQSGMGASWRIGVPKTDNHVDQLVTGGLHRVSRNPVYLGIMIFLAGAFLAPPGPLKIIAGLGSFIGLTAIIREEERYLRDRFGDDYDGYARRVRRWI